jgi:hypothetical protein
MPSPLRLVLGWLGLVSDEVPLGCLSNSEIDEL